jgi:serine/threonine-protein kinase HipA
MTMLQRQDGDGADYVELAESFAEFASRTVDDLEQLWRRVAFSIAIHNTDDHLRNHGFLREGAGWKLSPVFDINPNPDVTEARATSIGGAYRRDEEIDGLLLSAATFGLTDEYAGVVLSEIFDATRNWQQTATGNGIPKAQVAQFTDAFEGLRMEATERVRRRKDSQAPSY